MGVMVLRWKNMNKTVRKFNCLESITQKLYSEKISLAFQWTLHYREIKFVPLGFERLLKL